MPSSVWSGHLTFGLISMPVRLFSGARSSGISFNQLHRDDVTRVKQQLICPLDNKVLERSDIVKGYEYRKNEYVVVEPEEIKQIDEFVQEFRIVSQDGKPPPPERAGWKDTAPISKGGASEILVRFPHQATQDDPYMAHCHILEHEDSGMMAQFTV